MKSKFIPDLMVINVYSIDYKKLIESGKKILIFDIDNTLVPYEVEKPDEKLEKLFKMFDENNLKYAFVSNNGEKRVKLFNKSLNAFYICNAKKPSKKAYLQILAKYEILPTEAVAIGDQIFTDIMAANRCGIYSILVPPINDKKTLFFKAKRALEKPFIKKYNRKK